MRKRLARWLRRWADLLNPRQPERTESVAVASGVPSHPAREPVPVAHDAAFAVWVREPNRRPPSKGEMGEVVYEFGADQGALAARRFQAERRRIVERLVPGSCVFAMKVDGAWVERDWYPRDAS